VTVAAYVLLGDPAWLVPSIASYYDRVTTIVASYDQDHRSWSGAPMGPEMRACIRLLRDHDPDHKVVLLPGAFARPDEHPQEGETHQRQASIDAASAHGDWVLQLDTDEIVHDADRFFRELDRTEQAGLDALEYPARWVYAHLFDRWYLERATRRLRTWDAVPGPVAVRAGTRLRYLRQTDAPSRRLRFGGDDGFEPLPVASAILHFSMVRTERAMRAKSRITAHAPDLDWDLRLRLWHEARRRPARAVVRSVVTPSFGSYRFTRLPAAYDADVVAEQTMAGDPDWLASPDGPGRELAP
jgi:hypothetical protein